MSEVSYFEIGSFWTLFYLLLEWSIRIIMLVIVPFRRSPDAAKGWLLLVFFLPIQPLSYIFLLGDRAIQGGVACASPDCAQFSEGRPTSSLAYKPVDRPSSRAIWLKPLP
ncbi:hypothetical protein ACVOMV_26145 (plasmid) [Mesorhizobium atlanticum]|uniref:hypothetical protein n=1 Tax=Mesorhizobium atlanticum TaxID=2233532 RepID=UPI003703BABD